MRELSDAVRRDQLLLKKLGPSIAPEAKGDLSEDANLALEAAKNVVPNTTPLVVDPEKLQEIASLKLAMDGHLRNLENESKPANPSLADDLAGKASAFESAWRKFVSAEKAVPAAENLLKTKKSELADASEKLESLLPRGTDPSSLLDAAGASPESSELLAKYDEVCPPRAARRRAPPRAHARPRAGEQRGRQDDERPCEEAASAVRAAGCRAVENSSIRRGAGQNAGRRPAAHRAFLREDARAAPLGAASKAFRGGAGAAAAGNDFQRDARGGQSLSDGANGHAAAAAARAGRGAARAAAAQAAA